MLTIRFYFDFCDYRSYFLAKELESLADLPIQVEWIALDSYSLRAMSGEGRGHESEGGLAYEHIAAERHAAHYGYKFSWPHELINSGLALRASAWIMEKRAKEFESFARKLLHFIWAEGRGVCISTIQTACEQFSFGMDEIMSFGAGRDQFLIQDRYLKLALAEGVFDVPFLVFGAQHKYHGYGSLNQLRRIILNEWLQSIERERISLMACEFLMNLKSDDLRSWTQRRSVVELDNEVAPFDAPMQRLSRRNLRQPVGQRAIPNIPASEVLPLQFSSITAEQESIINAFAKSQLELFSICYGDLANVEELELLIEKLKKRRLPKRFMLAPIRLQGQFHWLHLESSSNSLITHRQYKESEENHGFFILQFGSWKIACIFQSFQCELNNARLAAASGAHALLLWGQHPKHQIAAMAIVSQRWVIHCHEGISLCDQRGRFENATELFQLVWPANGNENASIWIAEPARTMLLCEEPFSIGALRANADLELSCQGNSLLVATESQKNLLSESRIDERFNFGSKNITLIPLKGEQIYSTEVLSYKLLESLQRATEQSRMILVNYWSELEFDDLEALRPLLASIVEQWKIPLVTVIGHQGVEIWLCNAQGQAYRVEKEGEKFILDFVDITLSQQWFQESLALLLPNEEGFIETLQKLTELLRSQSERGS